MGACDAVDFAARAAATGAKVSEREIVIRRMCVLGAGHQRRATPKDLPPHSAVHDYLEVV